MCKRSLLLATSMIAGVAAASSAWAQTASPETKPAPAAAVAPASEIDAIVVTGSRLKTSIYSSASPIQVISSEQASLEGRIDTAGIIQGSSVASGSFQAGNNLTGYVGTGGPGVSTISLRGLGANRTLVLLDGHRIAPSGVRGEVGPTDLSSIPNAIIDRVEILKDGASSIYGSDAVAGVVNYITKKNLDGGSIKLYGSAPFSSGGGGQEYTAEGLWGKTFSRGHVNVTGSYYKQMALRRGDRDYTSCASENNFDPDTGARLDYTDAIKGGIKCYNLINNVAYTSGLGYLQYTQPGVDYSYAGNDSTVAGMARVARANYPETFRYANYESSAWDRATVISPVERYSLYVKGGYDLGGGAEAYGEVLYNRRNSEQDSVRQFFPTVSTSNPNNIFGTAGGTAYPIIALASDSIQKVDYYHALGGVRGDLSALADSKLDFLKSWSWDAYAQYGKSDGAYSDSSINNDAVVATTGASACDQSKITISKGDCSTLSNGIPWFSERVLAGDFTDAEKKFLFGVDTGHTVYEQWMTEATATGDLFALPAGTVGAAIGVSFRKDDFDDTPGAASQTANNWNTTRAGHTAGHDATTEVFVELNVPLVKDVFLVRSLDLSLSGRHTEVDSYGDSDTYKIGLNWQITPSWRLRLSDGTSFRAPSLYELHLADQTSYPSNVDPCIMWGTSGVNATVQANCQAQGISSDQGNYSSLVYTGGGSGNLKAETSESKTAGLIWTPQFMNLQVAIDYSEIDIENEITQFGAANIAQRCYESVNLTSSFCSLVSRDSTGAMVVHNNYVNVAEQVNRAIDLNVDYHHDFPLGRMTFHSEFTWQLQDTTKLFGDSEESDYNGSTYIYDGPDFSGRMNLSFRHDDWTVNWTTSITGKGSDAELIGDTVASSKYATANDYDYVSGGIYYKYVYRKYHTEFMAYHDLSFRKALDDKTALTFGIQNLFDEAPPSSSSSYRVGNSAAWGYDLKGRTGFLSVERSW